MGESVFMYACVLTEFTNIWLLGSFSPCVCFFYFVWNKAFIDGLVCFLLVRICIRRSSWSPTLFAALFTFSLHEVEKYVANLYCFLELTGYVAFLFNVYLNNVVYKLFFLIFVITTLFYHLQAFKWTNKQKYFCFLFVYLFIYLLFYNY